jgi:branched-subunit amino acid ABC-type transport system permease component
MGQVIVAGLVSGSIYGIIALGLVMVYRGSRVLNFAQVELGTFGLYVAWWLIAKHHMPWLVGALAAVVVVGGISAAFEALVVRRMTDAPRLAVAVATIGLLLFLVAAEIKVFGASPEFLRAPVRGIGPRVLGYHVSPTQMIAFVLAVAGGYGINAFLRRTDFGLAVLASAQDPSAVRMMGVRLSLVSQFTWVTAGVLSAVAVLLFEPGIGSFQAGLFSAGANALFVPALAAALLGGLVDLNRAFLGGLAIGVVHALVDHLFTHVHWLSGASSAMVFLVIVGALVLRPASLAAAEVS